MAPALCGPTCSSPPTSTQAMLPPPAPMERTSTLGMPRRSSPNIASGEITRRPARIAETSKVVPPMSMTMTSSSSVRCDAAMGASVGPDMTL